MCECCVDVVWMGDIHGERTDRLLSECCKMLCGLGKDG